MSKRALTGAGIFDGRQLHDNAALLLDGAQFDGIVPDHAIPPRYDHTNLQGGYILPGFVDLQVNGGGGIMFNDQTTASGLRTMAEALERTGTRAFLPTLITDTAERTRMAVDAVADAISENVRGIVGLHLEGPHLSVARKGAHDPSLIRPMDVEDEKFLLDAAQRLPNLLVTVAPESVTPDQITRLAQAGIIVSLGHSDCSFDQAQAAFAAGARCVTHLFNAMSQMGNREPGLVGAALRTPNVSAGLIADGIHVHAASMQAAFAAKRSPGEIFLVTDAMAAAGSDITEFELNGRRILRKDGRLTLQDGTLAGADLDFSKAVRIMVQEVGLPVSHALALATSTPAALLTKPGTAGRFEQGQTAAAIHLAADFSYIGGL